MENPPLTPHVERLQSPPVQLRKGPSFRAVEKYRQHASRIYADFRWCAEIRLAPDAFQTVIQRWSCYCLFGCCSGMWNLALIRRCYRSMLQGAVPPNRGVLSGTTKHFVCLKPLFDRIFCMPCTSAPVERVLAMEVCSSGLTEPGCSTSCCVTWCWQNVTELTEVCRDSELKELIQMAVSI